MFSKQRKILVFFKSSLSMKMFENTEIEESLRVLKNPYRRHV